MTIGTFKGFSKVGHTLTIYDSYGKLLKNINNHSIGWDGI